MMFQFEGSTKKNKKTFYTCLYRALLFPRVFYEYDMHGNPYHFSPYSGNIHPGFMYADNGFWDTYRTVYPFLSLFYPERCTEIMKGWLNAAEEGKGWFPKWASPGFRDMMVGTHMDAIVADTFSRGIKFDIEKAYEYIKKDASIPGAEDGRKVKKR